MKHSSLVWAFLLLALLILSPRQIYAQKATADSLERLLKKATADTARIDYALQLSRIYLGSNGEKAMSLANQALSLSLRLKDQHRIGLSCNARGNVFLIFYNNPDSAMAEYRKVYAIARAKKDKYLEGFALNNFGNIEKLNGDFYKAQKHYEQAIEIRRQIRDSSGLAGSLSNLGSVYQQKGDFKKALDLYYEALPIKQKENNPAALATTYENLGILHLDRKEPRRALEMLIKAKDLYLLTGNDYRLSKVLNSIAIAHFDQQEYDDALVIYQQSLEMRQAMHDSDGIAECYTNIGNVYYTKQDNQTALKYYRMAMTFASGSVDIQRVAILCNFAIGLARVGKSDSALVVADSAFVAASRTGTPDLLIAVLGAYEEVYEISGQYEKALGYMKKRVALSDSVFRSESARQINELDALYQKSEQDREIGQLKVEQDMMQKDQEKKDLMIYAFAVGTILLLLLVVFALRAGAVRKKANIRLGEQNKIIAEKNKDITDSITYARRIQQSVLPDEKILLNGFSEYFILNKPRDIVSGDFFWLAQKGNRIYIAVADCTGHGVPGALVSVVGINMLNKIIEQPQQISPAEILDQLHVLIINALNKDAGARDTQDGMDIGLLCIDKTVGKAWFAGAGRPLYYSPAPGTIEQIRGDRYSIAGEKKIDSDLFSQTEIDLNPESRFYLSSDGYADQFGGTEGKKFMSKRFVALLASASPLSMNAQKEKIDSAYEEWKGRLDQVDDVLVLGIKV